jgi:hypothetical protein
MATESTIVVLGGDRSYKLIVEPWADEFWVHPNDRCKIVMIHPAQMMKFEVEWHDDALVVYDGLGDVTYQFWRDDKLEFEMPVRSPGPLGGWSG